MDGGRVEGAKLPPPHLIDRVGRTKSFPDEVIEARSDLVSDEIRAWDEVGAGIRRLLDGWLPSGWSWSEKAVLDFGCGAGRVLRHFLVEAQTAEFWGCDIDGPSIAWLQAELSPPLHVLSNGARPPIDLPDGKFDLIYAVSVFTHLVESWSEWLLEMRRLLKPDGLFLATFHGSGMAYVLDRLPWHDPWEEDSIGMHVLGMGTPWSDGGPSVHHSRWWLTEHWGRLFEPLRIDPGSNGHGVFVGRPRNAQLTTAALEAADPEEPREARALAYSRRQAWAETAAIRESETALKRAVAELGLPERSPRVRRSLPRLGDLRSPRSYLGGSALHRRLAPAHPDLDPVWARQLYRLARHADRDHIPGGLVECTTRNGGHAALLSAGSNWRQVRVLGPLGPEDGARLQGELDRYGNGEGLRLLSGPIAEELAQAARFGPIAMVHCSSGLGEGVREALETAYPLVSEGGFVAVDDYPRSELVRRIVDGFMSDLDGPPKLRSVRYGGCWWRKPARAAAPARSSSR